MEDNGQSQGELRKKCPFLDGKPCIGGECAIYIQIAQQRLGVKSLVGVCAFPGLAMIMSSKQQPAPTQGINLGDLRGKQ